MQQRPLTRRFREAEGDAPAGTEATDMITPPPARPFAAGTSWMLEATDKSLEDRLAAVGQALRKKYESDLNCGPCPWPEVTFDDYVIVRKGDQRWRLDLSFGAEGVVTLGDAVPVTRIRYETAKEATARADAPASYLLTSSVLTPLSDDGRLLEGEDAAAALPSGKQWGVVIIQEGMSKNRRHYRRAALQESAALYEGARMYTDHAETPRRYGKRSVKECVGFLKDVRPAIVPPDGQATLSESGQGKFVLTATACVTKESWRRELVDAYTLGKPDLFGLSHDAACQAVVAMDAERQPYHDVLKVTQVDSVDWVIGPAAGGRVIHAVATNTVDPTLEEDGRMLTKMIEAIQASGNAALIAKLGATPTEDVVLAVYGELKAQEAVAAAAAQSETEAEGAEHGDGTTRTRESEAGTPGRREGGTEPLPAQMTEAEVTAMRGAFSKLLIDKNLAECALPDVLKTRIRKRLLGTVEAVGAVTEDQVVESIRDEVEVYGQLAEKGIVMPAKGERVELGKGPSDKFVEALDTFFDPSKPATSFRGIYVDFTGDTRVSGRVEEATRLTEAIGSSTFDKALGDAITRRMVKEYQASPLANWRGVVADVVPLSDWRTQRRVRMGGYGNLPIVGERAPYPALTTPSDEEATYAAAKRGGTESISIEAIKNDDVGVIRRIPGKMGRAAAHTLHEFVWDLVADNPTLYDSVALIASGHANMETSALSETTVAALRLKIKSQTELGSGKKIGLVAKYIIGPDALEETIYKLLRTERALGSNNNDRNFVASLGLTPVIVNYWTDANNYFVCADPTQTEMIEVGFIDGREDPELFLQDQPNVGQMFSNDVLTYKLRHAYGGAWIDYRGIAGGLVA